MALAPLGRPAGLPDTLGGHLNASNSRGMRQALPLVKRDRYRISLNGAPPRQHLGFHCVRARFRKRQKIWLNSRLPVKVVVPQDRKRALLTRTWRQRYRPKNVLSAPVRAKIESRK